MEYKDKKPDMPDFHRNIEAWCNSKIKLPKYKDLCNKSFEKVLQDEWTYVAEATIIKLMNSINSNKLWDLLPALNTVTVDTKEALTTR